MSTTALSTYECKFLNSSLFISNYGGRKLRTRKRLLMETRDWQAAAPVRSGTDFVVEVLLELFALCVALSGALADWAATGTRPCHCLEV